MIVFVDFDGTITDIDTFDALVRRAAGGAAWDELDADFSAGRRTLRQTLARQARAICMTEAEALAFLAANVVVDPAFRPFVEAARAAGAEVLVVSSGIAPLIRTVLARAGVEVPVYANGVDFAPSGWTMTFIDDSANGHDKAARVQAAHAAGATTIFVGDGVSDFDAARVAGRCYAKCGRALERYCRRLGIAYTPFTSFEQIRIELFGPAAHLPS